MSSSLRTLCPSSGSFTCFRIPWDTFVQAVLSVTVEAYQQMRNQIPRPHWEEDTLTACLAEDYIAPLGREHPLNLIVVPQGVVYKPKMKAGETTTRKASKIDIKLFLVEENYHQVYFAWECKWICPKHVDSDLISKYVTQGMLRFINEKYSVRLDDAGMLAYVASGDVAIIIDDINQSMVNPRRNQALAAADHLKLDAPVADFTDVYQSCHTRTPSQSNIRLHHLFLTFD